MARGRRTYSEDEDDSNSTFPMKCSLLRRNGYIIIQKRPCKIVELNTSNPGKHGHAKVRIVALDVFTGKKLEDLSPATHNVTVPEVVKKDYLLVDASDEHVSLLDENSGEIRRDMRLPGGKLGEDIKLTVDEARDAKCTVLTACGEEGIIGIRNVKEQK